MVPVLCCTVTDKYRETPRPLDCNLKFCGVHVDQALINILCKAMYYSVKATITKYYNLGGLNNRNGFSHSSGGWKSHMKVSMCLISPLFGLHVATPLLCSHMSFLCVYKLSVSLLIKTPVLLP